MYSGSLRDRMEKKGTQDLGPGRHGRPARATPATRKLRAADRRFLWHPFTQMRGWMTEDFPVIVRGRGVHLWDSDGRRYIDGISSLWCNVHGHGRSEIDSAVRAQLKKIAHSTLLGLSCEPAIECARRLVEIAPRGLTRVFYSDSGATSVEIALKMAFQYWQLRGRPRKKKFLTLAEGYHGDTIGSVSLGGMDLFHRIFKPLLFDTIKAPTTYCYRCGRKAHGSCRMQCVDEVVRLVHKHAAELSAVAAEPLVQGAAGMILQPKGFMKRIREACDECGVLLICDEVATGFGRTGTMFACEQEGVAPDIMTVAKGITGGYLPLAATLAKEEIYEAFLGEFAEKKTFYHGHTYTGNALACAAAMASLDIFRREGTVRGLRPKIRLMRDGLESLRALDHVGDVRQCGMMAGIELVKDRATRESFPVETRMGHRVILDARRRGAILRPLGDVLVLMPPLSITEGELARLIDVARASVVSATRG
jgi:adenosylmethionine-8-amino-7-oxononanoate aminotransferase